MQASTQTYVENAQHDLSLARSLSGADMGALDPRIAPALVARHIESAEKMLRSLRVAVEAFEKVVDSMRVLLSQATVALSPSSDLYCVTLLGWIADVSRMCAAEIAHKKLVLATLGARVDAETVERHVQAWMAEPMINHSLIAQIEEAVL